MRRLLPCLVVLASTAAAQTLDDVRQAMRDAMHAGRFPLFAASFLGLAEEMELSGGNFTITSSGPDMDLSILTYPLRDEFDLGEGWPNLLVEASVGYAKAKLRTDDVWSGELPGLETATSARFETYGGSLGAGPLLPLGADWELGLLANFGVAHVSSTAYYQGPGAPITAALLDGILFNWDATYAIYGGSVLLRREAWRWGDVVVAPHLRYELRHMDPFEYDDVSQNESSTVQWLLGRVGFEGPTGWNIGQGDVRWVGDLGAKVFDKDAAGALGFGHYFELGAGLRWGCADVVPGLSRFGISGAVFAGDDITGWSVGMGIEF